MEIYYEEAEREVEPNEILSITIGSIVEGCDIDGPTITLERKDGTLTKANFNKALEMINKECDNLWKQANYDWAYSDGSITKEERDVYATADEYYHIYECWDFATMFGGQQLSDEEIDKEILKIFMHTDTYNPEWEKEKPYELSLYQLGRELYKYTDCGPWTSFEVKDEEPADEDNYDDRQGDNLLQDSLKYP
jgi:hypothetical protein